MLTLTLTLTLIEVEQLCLANESDGGAPIVILSEMHKPDMDTFFHEEALYPTPTLTLTLSSGCATQTPPCYCCCLLRSSSTLLSRTLPLVSLLSSHHARCDPNTHPLIESPVFGERVRLHDCHSSRSNHYHNTNTNPNAHNPNSHNPNPKHTHSSIQLTPNTFRKPHQPQ